MFAPKINLPTGAGPMAVRAADLNHDGFSDLIVANYAGATTSIFLGYGNGTFKQRIDLSNGVYAGTHGIDIGDVNEDGHLDIVVVNRNGSNIGIFLGVGNGSFSSQKTISTGTGSTPVALVLHDLNNDRHLDLVVTDHMNDRIFIYRGEGDATFTKIQTQNTGNNSGPYLVIVNDFNRDEQMDIAVGSDDGNLLQIFYGDRSEYFSQEASYQIDGGPYAIVAADFNRDGKLDIATANYDGNDASILLGMPQGSFRQVYRFSTGNGSLPYAIAIGDFNGDYIHDLIFSNSGTNDVAVLLGLGGGRFHDAKSFSTGIDSKPVDVTIADLNGDHRPDFISANNGSNTINIFLNTCF